MRCGAALFMSYNKELSKNNLAEDTRGRKPLSFTAKGQSPCKRTNSALTPRLIVDIFLLPYAIVHVTK